MMTQLPSRHGSSGQRLAGVVVFMGLILGLFVGSALAWPRSYHGHGHSHRHGHSHQNSLYGYRNYGLQYNRRYSYPRHSLSYSYPGRYSHTNSSPRYYSYSRSYSNSYPRYYGSFSYRPSYGYYGGSALAPIQVPSQTPTYNSPSDVPSGTNTQMTGGRAWDLLAQGRPYDALQIFADQATNNPAKGGPKVGFALSAASTGDLSTGIWAMRRACAIDPSAMHYVRLSNELRKQVDALIARYESTSGSGVPFMLASLRYLKDDIQGAQAAIDQAIGQGDQTESAKHLRRLIAEKRTELQEQPQTLPSPTAPESAKGASPPLPAELSPELTQQLRPIPPSEN